MIYDHLLMFSDEAAAHSALDPLGYGGTDPEGGAWWHGGCVQGGIPVTLPSGPNGERVQIAAYFVRVSLPEISAALKALPDNACRAVGIQETGETVLVSPDVAPEIAAATRVEVVPCGSGYDFPAE